MNQSPFTFTSSHARILKKSPASIRKIGNTLLFLSTDLQNQGQQDEIQYVIADRQLTRLFQMIRSSVSCCLLLLQDILALRRRLHLRSHFL
mmetsp:Transcript_28415/g.33067  ORF Transcript_28415/g.33067 Transcript_28415/m.33067 type:complete len:91 (+) Transcript_28415:152-424(+)